MYDIITNLLRSPVQILVIVRNSIQFENYILVPKLYTFSPIYCPLPI